MTKPRTIRRNISSPWDRNEDGHWCPACGDLIRAVFETSDDSDLPDSCKQCGFPDFEDGHGYFTGD
jgi:hypothetical protein